MSAWTIPASAFNAEVDGGSPTVTGSPVNLEKVVSTFAFSVTATSLADPGHVTLSAQGSLDGENWYILFPPAGGEMVNSFTGGTALFMDTGDDAAQFVRVLATAATTSGTQAKFDLSVIVTGQ